MSTPILIVEDNPDNLNLMLYLLRAYGYAPWIAYDGAEALAIIRTKRPELILCDVQLPRLDGYAVASALQADPQLARIPLIAVTSYAMVGDRDKILQAGFDGYISKPIDPDQFVAQVEAYLRPDQRSPIRPHMLIGDTQPSPTLVPAPKRGRILIVDNRPQNLFLLHNILGPLHYEVYEANSVAEALVCARRQQPALIITDLHMPGADGFDLIRLLRLDDELAHIPVVIHSATDTTKLDEEEAQRLGVAAFIGRPIEPADLLFIVGSLLAPLGVK